ncbi:RING-H2 finger protein ATL52 [Apostasia shenzhenica]|uniref:RING-type E3 ubiquitin transferase n=1 Tax=Apostasia shenzhenica TaxID=1088818 RepID=A0A2I0A0P9_9ASPA|nr:RING-H2 finger protein ATL52 [Apostasia shenzhenica]
MASTRRLLLFTDGNSNSDGYFNFNGSITVECIANCIGVCIYGVCFAPPPTSSTSLPSDGGKRPTPIGFHGHDRLLSTVIITASSGVAAALIILLSLYAFFRLRRRRRRRGHHGQFPPPIAAAAAAAANDDDHVGDDLLLGGEIEHHIWYIRTPGLDERTIASISSWVYKSSDGLVDARDCSVCLGEFRDGELVRLLPKCSHAFHLHCIDRWLRSHVNCPLCRAPIVSPAAATASPAPSPASPSTAVAADSAVPETRSSSPSENTNSGSLPLESSSRGIEVSVVIHTGEGSSSRPSTSDLPPHSTEVEEVLQPIRRSVSMDSFSLDAIHNGRRKEEVFPREEEGRVSTDREKQESYISGSLTHKGPRNMDRSLSSQSARWIFSRHGQSRNSVLPL